MKHGKQYKHENLKNGKWKTEAWTLENKKYKWGMGDKT